MGSEMCIRDRQSTSHVTHVDPAASLEFSSEKKLVVRVPLIMMTKATADSRQSNFNQGGVYALPGVRPDAVPGDNQWGARGVRGLFALQYGSRDEARFGRCERRRRP